MNELQTDLIDKRLLKCILKWVNQQINVNEWMREYTDG